MPGACANTSSGSAPTPEPFVGNVNRFGSGRHFASYLGLTPREYSSAHRRYLGRISKKGDSYLRTLLIHGARAVLRVARTRHETDRLCKWGCGVQDRRGSNKAAVAIANKMARIVWAVWKRTEAYQPRPAGLPETEGPAPQLQVR